MPTPPPAPPRPSLRLLRALATPRARAMLALGISSGLPFALLIGTLNAWLGEVGIKLATIGVLSWIGLCYTFKFLWAPLVDRLRLPLLAAWLGPRRSWILACQVVLAVALVALALTDPLHAIGRFAMLAFIAALASATQDIAIDAWRIEGADAVTSIELLSAIYQFGYRTASIIGGALALVLAAWLGWPGVFVAMAGLIALIALATLTAPEPVRHRKDRTQDRPGLTLPPAYRAVLVFVVLASWCWALTQVAGFMIAALTQGSMAPSVTAFTRATGPLIVAAMVAVPLAAAVLANGLSARVCRQAAPAPSGALHGAIDHVWSALIVPLAELAGRLRWGLVSLIGFILTYALAYNLWASFAFPFYLGALHYTKEEVAFASKLFGVAMTMLGISLSGVCFARIGRMPTVLIGAMLPPLGNFLYADLAEGGRGIDAFAHLLRLDALAMMLGSSERMVRLLLAIAFENVAIGVALTAFVAYVSGVVSRRYNVIQYALLSSLTSLVGTLGRGAVGAAFDRYGYAPVFRAIAAAGLVSLIFVLAEWWRVSRVSRD